MKKKKITKQVRSYQRFINGVKVVVEAEDLKEADKKFNSYIKSNE